MNHESQITDVFWSNVNSLMADRGMNIYTLAEKCGLARRSLERSRQRNAVPDGYNTFLIAQALEVSVEDLFILRENVGFELETALKSLSETEKTALLTLLRCYLSKKVSD